MKILATIGKFVVKVAKMVVSFLTKSPLTELVANATLTAASAVITFKVASISVRKIIKFFKKNKNNSNGTVMDMAKANNDVKDAVKESINKDQNIDQDMRLHGYSEKELDFGMKKLIREVNLEDGKIAAECKEEEDYDPSSHWFYMYDENHRNIIFYHRITKEQPYEFCEKLYRKLCKHGFIKGPWNANPHRRAIEEAYGQ